MGIKIVISLNNTATFFFQLDTIRLRSNSVASSVTTLPTREFFSSTLPSRSLMYGIDFTRDHPVSNRRRFDYDFLFLRKLQHIWYRDPSHQVAQSVHSLCLSSIRHVCGHELGESVFLVFGFCNLEFLSLFLRCSKDIFSML